ncbi:MAG: citramalate synthase [Candidatus Omnitrophica bacterium]|nr:citramalate synthase [Candidatus Omnitrophota bacterium]
MPAVDLYDTTLRDGAQTEGISYSVQDKLRITERLDALGVHYIEGGWPGSNPKDAELFRRAKRLRLASSTLTAFGSTRRAGMAANKDRNLSALLKAETRVITIFGKSWDLHAREVLGVSLDENLKMIEESVRFLKRHGRTVFYDAEHFFDGYRDNADYCLKTVQAAQDAGADAVVFCDTNGGTLPDRLTAIINEARRVLRVPTGIHVHNDCGLGVANSLAAAQAGCRQVQGTINGYGERCGNADLTAIIGVLATKMGIDCLPKAKLRELTEVSRFVAEVSNMTQRPSQPFVGEAAFAHKGGVHVNAVLKTPRSYEHVDPAQVGNERKILVSELSGRSSLVVKAKGMRLSLAKDTPQAKKLLALLQKLEHEGYHFEAAEGSFELLLQRHLKALKPFFQLEGFRVIIEQRDGAMVSEATIKLRVDGVAEHAAAEGDGPVNALDNAIRKALRQFYPTLAQMHLTDFKVRVLDEKAGTAAKVRVLIQSQDAHDSWGTIGVSENVIEASWRALVDSIEYKLLKDQKQKSEDGSQKSERAVRKARTRSV